MDAKAASRGSDLKFGWKRRVSVVRQAESSECGLACLVMLLNYYGNGITLSELRDTSASSSNGTALSELIRIASRKEMEARALRVDLTELSSLKLPAIAHLDFDHFVVISRAGSKAIRIADPASGERLLTWREMSDRFTGVVLEVSPSPSFVPQRPARPRLSIRHLFFSPKGIISSMAVIVAISLLLEIVSLILPLATQLIIDRVVLTADNSLLIGVTAAFLAFALLQVFASAVRGWRIAMLELNLSLQWSRKLFSHLLKLPMSFFQRRSLGDVVSRFDSLNALQLALANKSPEIVIDGLRKV